MATTASCAQVLPFPQAPDRDDPAPELAPLCTPRAYSDSVYHPCKGAEDDYYNNNNYAHARIVGSPPDLPPDKPHKTAAEIRAKQARDTQKQQDYIARVEREYWLSSVSADMLHSYHDVMGRPMPDTVRNEIAAMIHAGIDRCMIAAIIDYTASAPRPSWAYARAVIQRNKAKGINSWVDFMDSIGQLYTTEEAETEQERR